MKTLLVIVMSIIGTLLICGLAIRFYIRRNTVGTFRFDNNEQLPMCTFELEKIPESFEQSRYVLAKVAKADLSLPGSHKSQ